MNLRAIVLKTDDTTERVTIKDYLDIQKYVGEAPYNVFTSVPVLHDTYLAPDSGVFANDEGLLIGLPRNFLAEQITGYPTLVGDVVVLGGTNDEGDSLSLSEATMRDIELAALEMRLF